MSIQRRKGFFSGVEIISKWSIENRQNLSLANWMGLLIRITFSYLLKKILQRVAGTHKKSTNRPFMVLGGLTFSSSMQALLIFLIHHMWDVCVYFGRMALSKDFCIEHVPWPPLATSVSENSSISLSSLYSGGTWGKGSWYSCWVSQHIRSALEVQITHPGT